MNPPFLGRALGFFVRFFDCILFFCCIGFMTVDTCRRHPAPVKVCSLSNHLHVFLHPRWLGRISEPPTVWHDPCHIEANRPWRPNWRYFRWCLGEVLGQDPWLNVGSIACSGSSGPPFFWGVGGWGGEIQTCNGNKLLVFVFILCYIGIYIYMYK